MPRKITDYVLSSYVQCKSKAYLHLNGCVGEKTDYETFTNTVRRQVAQTAIPKLQERYAGDAVQLTRPATRTDLEDGKLLLVSTSLANATCDCRIDCLQRVAGESCLGPFHYVPVAIHQGPRTTRSVKYRMALAPAQASFVGLFWEN